MIEKINEIVAEHESAMERAEPEFNMCDLAVQVGIDLCKYGLVQLLI